MSAADVKRWEEEYRYVRLTCLNESFGPFGNSEARFRDYVAEVCATARNSGFKEQADLIERTTQQLLAPA